MPNREVLVTPDINLGAFQAPFKIAQMYGVKLWLVNPGFTKKGDKRIADEWDFMIIEIPQNKLNALGLMAKILNFARPDSVELFDSSRKLAIMY